MKTIAGSLHSLTSLSLVNCTRITEAGIDELTTSCRKLFTLNMTNCEQIRRRYLHQVWCHKFTFRSIISQIHMSIQLVKRLEFVDWASSYFGIEPLPNAIDLQLKVSHIQHNSY